MKNIGGITVNDGKGLYDNAGLCDSLINDINTALKLAFTGQYVQGCAIVTGMAQKLVNLKAGITKELESHNAKIEELKRVNDSLAEQVTGLPVERVVDNGES